MTQKLTEFYTEKQGRPDSKVALDMESRRPSASRSYLVTVINQVLEEVMDDRLVEMISKLEELLVELRKSNLHLASGSDETIAEEDTEDS